ncbi:MAG: hypothetical protein ACRDO7_15250 [Nocardioidaceae bacterium]
MADDRGSAAQPGARRGLAAAAAVLAIVGIAGCGSDTSSADGRSDQVRNDSRPGEKTGSGEVRRDLRPLTKRFGALGVPRQATWMSGTLGDSDVPGPSSYWIDAIVTLAPGEAAALERRYAAAETDQRPDVIGDLEAELPEGPLLASERLDEAFSESGFATQAYIDVASDRVILTAKGQ